MNSRSKPHTKKSTRKALRDHDKLGTTAKKKATKTTRHIPGGHVSKAKAAPINKARSPSLPRGGRAAFDWTHLSKGPAGKAFEDMCLDLFGSEYDDVDFVPGPRRSGKDGGVDATYNGVVGRQGARWKIACAVRNDIAALATKVALERDQALDRNFNGLIVFTSLDITAVQAKKLVANAMASVKNGKKSTRLKHAHVWGRATLERLLTKHPWVAATHFGHPLLPGFVPLLATQRDVPDQPDLALVGRADEIRSVRAFVSSDDSVLVVVGAGGSGKSRFLREIRDVVQRLRPRRSSWLRRPGIGNVTDAILHGLPPEQAILIALDDAGAAASEIGELASATQVGPDPLRVKLVLAARSVDEEIVVQHLRAIATVRYQLLRLSPLSQGEAKDLVRLENGGLRVDTVERIVGQFGPNLFLLRAAAGALARGQTPRSLLQDNGLRTLVAQRFVREATTRLRALLQSQAAHRQVLLTCLDVPIETVSASTPQRTMLAAGLLRSVGSTLRVRSDVEGDLLLGYLLEQPWAQAVLHEVLAEQPDLWPNRIRNLAAAGPGYPAQVIRTTCETFLAEAPDAEPEAIRQALELLPRCTVAAPDLVPLICRAYAQNDDTLTLDDFGPAVEVLSLRDPLEALQLMRALRETSVQDGGYANYSLQQLAHGAFTLLHLPYNLAEQVLERLDEWVAGSPTGAAIEVVQAILSGLLLPFVRQETGDGATITIREHGVPATAPVLSLRQRVFGLVAKMFSHPDVPVRLAAAALLREHSRLSGGGMISASQLKAAHAREFVDIAGALRTCLLSEQNVRVLDALEEGLLVRVFTHRPGAEAARALLNEIEWPWQLRAFRLATKPAEFYLDVRKILAAAPAGREWSWWVDRSSRRMIAGIERAEIDDLFSQAPERYRTPEGLLELLDELGDRDWPWGLVDPWCEKHPQLFQEALGTGDESFRSPMPRRALRRRAFRNGELDPVMEVQQNLSQAAPVEITRIMLEDLGSLRDDQVISIAERLSAAEDLELRQLGLERLRFASTLGEDTIVRVLNIALRDGLWLNGWGTVWTLTRKLPGDEALAEFARAVIAERLGDLLGSDRWDGYGNDGWYMREMFAFLGDQNVQRRLDLVRRASEHSFWRETAATLVAPLLRPRDRLEKLLIVLAEMLGSERVSFESCAHLLGAANDTTPWSDSALEVGRNFLDVGDESKRRIGLALLSEMRNSPEACALIAEMAASTDPLQRAALSALSKFGLPRGIWSSSLGEAPPELVAVRERLQAARSLARTAKARRLIAEQERWLERTIRRHLQRDEEFVASR